MEQIKGILAKFQESSRPGTATLHLRNSEPAITDRALPLEEMRKSLGVSSLQHTFENFSHVPGTEAPYAAFLARATREDARPLLICYGGVGNGKTYLCEALAIALYKRGIFIRVGNFSRMMIYLKQSITPDAGLPDCDTVLTHWCQVSWLIIDDVGAGGITEWERNQLEKIICFRYHERLKTVVTTNRQLTDLGERIVSRFSDPEVAAMVLNEAGDYRRAKCSK